MSETMTITPAWCFLGLLAFTFALGFFVGGVTVAWMVKVLGTMLEKSTDEGRKEGGT